MVSFASSKPLIDLIAQHKSGVALGIPSICSANRFVIQACMNQYLSLRLPLLIESTCNQVNQYGGYTGFTPKEFTTYILCIADEVGFPKNRILLGGDHLGPFPWKDEPVAQAMKKSLELVRAYVKAGYQKIHIDTSMHCADDDYTRPLPTEIVARRTVQMVKAAEDSVSGKGYRQPVYVIGTEVPTPGGAQGGGGILKVTNPVEVADTIEQFQRVFAAEGLQNAWQRVIALVVQPGVEFGEEEIVYYDRDKARELSRFVEPLPGMVFEAHSTDYQKRNLLEQLVEDHFAILKVGPALTFAFREAIFSLAHVEQELLGKRKGIQLSQIIETIESVMLENPEHWKYHYSENTEKAAFFRIYSLSDRIRYYWSDIRVVKATKILIGNLENNPIPLSLLRQFMPCEYQRVINGEIKSRPTELIWSRIAEVVIGYLEACGEKVSK